jgi:GNAT superfamily N-acetyltransferase
MFVKEEGGRKERGRFFHMWMIGVASAGRGRGVGKKLAQHSVALAKAEAFEVPFAECTGALSTHILTKHTENCTVEHFIDYGDHTGAGRAARRRRSCASWSTRGTRAWAWR